MSSRGSPEYKMMEELPKCSPKMAAWATYYNGGSSNLRSPVTKELLCGTVLPIARISSSSTQSGDGIGPAHHHSVAHLYNMCFQSSNTEVLAVVLVARGCGGACLYGGYSKWSSWVMTRPAPCHFGLLVSVIYRGNPGSFTQWKQGSVGLSISGLTWGSPNTSVSLDNMASEELRPFRNKIIIRILYSMRTVTCIFSQLYWTAQL